MLEDSPFALLINNVCARAQLPQALVVKPVRFQFLIEF